MLSRKNGWVNIHEILEISRYWITELFIKFQVPKVQVSAPAAAGR